MKAIADISRPKVGRKTVPGGRRRGQVHWFLIAALSLLFAISRAADSSVSVAPPSPWISPLPFQRLTNSEDLNSGLESRLLLRDLQVNASIQETFHHEARQLLDRKS